MELAGAILGIFLLVGLGHLISLALLWDSLERARAENWSKEQEDEYLARLAWGYSHSGFL